MTQSEADKIEAGIARERASLASTLGSLQDRVSIENLAQEALGMIRTNAAAYTSSIDSAVRANPLALALTGVGVAWLVFGGKKAPEGPTRAENDGNGRKSKVLTSTDDAWSISVDALRARASAALRRIEDDARAYAGALRDGLSSGIDSARDFAADRARVLSDFTEGLQQSFASGLEDLQAPVRDQIVAMREQAYAARIRAERVASGGAREAGRLVEDHPLIAGGVALALGAALAAALPRTRIEDRTFGSESDRLMAEAARLLRQERDMAARVASGVAEELVDSAKSTIAAVPAQVADTMEAVKERAESEIAKASPQNGAAEKPMAKAVEKTA